MGLDIFYDIHADDSWDSARVVEVLRRTREVAQTLGFARLSEVVENDPDQPESICLRRQPRPDRFLSVDAVGGWLFRTWPGKGSETAFFGLCRFPARIEVDDESFATGYGRGWHYHTWCKTQYADMISREHFLKCHLGVIRILDFLKAQGLTVRVRDGGDYWKTRNVARLVKNLERMHGLVAAVAGAFKDATEGMPGQTVAPIMGAKDFEHLEAKGHAILKKKTSRSRKRSS